MSDQDQDADARDARLWRKHKDSFAVLLSMLDAASPLVLNKLRVEDAVKDAAASHKEEEEGADTDKNPVTVSITLGQGLCLGLTEEDHLVVQHMDSGQIQADLGEFSSFRAASLCEYIQRLAIHVE